MCVTRYRLRGCVTPLHAQRRRERRETSKKRRETVGRGEDQAGPCSGGESETKTLAAPARLQHDRGNCFAARRRGVRSRSPTVDRLLWVPQRNTVRHRVVLARCCGGGAEIRAYGPRLSPSGDPQGNGRENFDGRFVRYNVADGEAQTERLKTGNGVAEQTIKQRSDGRSKRARNEIRRRAPRRSRTNARTRPSHRLCRFDLF